ncbi:uncharacterized protein [Symphalangus syndactylus]|uniref:uncharacterized protein isoform X9 n=1 Tax=Symphalangus syndactylus TaxID=9590 RepID=UPI0030050DE3
MSSTVFIIIHFLESIRSLLYLADLDAHSKAYLKMLESYFESLDRRNARRAQDHQASVHGSGEKKEKSKAKHDQRSAEDVHGSAHGSGEKKEKSKAKRDQRTYSFFFKQLYLDVVDMQNNSPI